MHGQQNVKTLKFVFIFFCLQKKKKQQALLQKKIKTIFKVFSHKDFDI